MPASDGNIDWNTLGNIISAHILGEVLVNTALILDIAVTFIPHERFCVLLMLTISMVSEARNSRHKQIGSK